MSAAPSPVTALAGPAASPLRALPILPPPPAAVAPPGYEADLGEESAWAAVRRRLAPGVAMSLLLHLALLVALALWTITLRPRDTGPSLSASIGAESSDAAPLETAPPLRIDVDASPAEPLSAAVEAIDSDIAPPAGPQTAAQASLLIPLAADVVDLGGGRSAGLLDRLGEGSAASFFGAVSQGKRFVYVVDNSNSMRRNANFQKACDELLGSVSELSPKQKFYVIFFSDTDHPMFEPSLAPDLVEASSANRARLQQWVAGLKLIRGTNGKSAIKRALSLKPDAIYLLTDGQFTDDTERYLLGLEDNKVPIHTIGFRSRRGEAVLQRISEKHQGTYTYVP